MSPIMPPKASSHRGAGGDATSEPKDAPKGLPPQKGGRDADNEPRIPPKASNHMGAGGDAADEPDYAPKGFQPQEGRRGCSQ